MLTIVVKDEDGWIRTATCLEANESTLGITGAQAVNALVRHLYRKGYAGMPFRVEGMNMAGTIPTKLRRVKPGKPVQLPLI